MGATKKTDLDRRLDAYFATLRPAAFKDALKRSAANWQMYAAVTGSAMAMATSGAAAIIGSGTRDIRSASVASVLAANAAPGPGAPVVGGARLKASLAIPAAPSISPGGVVPLFSAINTIQPGEWVSIYGTKLAAETLLWNGDFPTTLGGTSVEIDGKPAYLEFVSPGQINVQAPDDTARGTVSVVVHTAAGSATSSVTLSDFGPSFSLLDSVHVAAIIVRSNGSGAYGGGSYDILGPTGNSLGYPTVAAKAGDIVELFGVGFGPTAPVVPAGEAFSGAAAVTSPVSLYINNVSVNPIFVGLSGTGLYQINLIVPAGIGAGDVPLQMTVGGMETQSWVLFSLQGNSIVTSNPITGGGTNPGGSRLYFTTATQPTHGTTQGPTGVQSGTGVGTGGQNGGTGGTGGGTAAHRKPYRPVLRFPQQ
jgi:uncharacterized protein (TIGR03437 family)